MNTIHVANSRTTERNVGIDVGKDVLDIAILELDTHWQIANNDADIQELMKQLRRYKLTRVVVEATGAMNAE
jgi:transposase